MTTIALNADNLGLVTGQAGMRSWLRGQAADRNGKTEWYVVEHHGRSGESLAEEMGRFGIRAWCPLRKIVKKRGKGNACRTASVPLFEGYVLVELIAGWEAAFLGILTFDKVRGILGREGQPMPLRGADVLAIKDFEAQTPHRQSILYKRGQELVITRGVFAGMMAVVLADHFGKGDVQAEVEAMGRAVPLRLGVDSVALV